MLKKQKTRQPERKQEVLSNLMINQAKVIRENRIRLNESVVRLNNDCACALI